MEKRLTQFISLLVFIIAPVLLLAQTPEREPLYFQTYTIEDGLPDNWIRDVTQDQQGYIWIATSSGVSRFDGYAFENFFNDPDDASTLSSNDVSAVLTDKDNQLWFGTNFGLNRFDRSSQTFQQYYHDPLDPGSLPGNEIIDIYESKNGTLWILTNRGLAAFDPNSESFRVLTTEADSEARLSHLILTSITESADGRIWIGTRGGGINILNPKTGDISYLRHAPDDPGSIPNDYILNLYIDRDQVLWVNYDRREQEGFALISRDQQGRQTFTFFYEVQPVDSPSGLWKMDISTGSVHHYMFNPERGHPLLSRSNFNQTRDGKLWISQATGLSAALLLYDVEKDTFFEYTYELNNPGTIAWNYTSAIYEDRFNYLWVATSRGLSRADRSQVQMSSFTPVPEDLYDSVNNFYGIVEVSPDRFWISSDGLDAIIDWDRGKNTWQLMTELSATRLPTVHDGNNEGWQFIGPRIIRRLDMQTLEKIDYELSRNADGDNSITHFLRLTDGNLIVATSEGLWKLDVGSGNFVNTDFVSPFANNEKLNIAYLATESSGKVWLAANNASLNASGSELGILLAKYDPETGLFEFPDIDNSYIAAFGNGSANHISVDSRGHVWVSKSNGVVQLDPETNRVTTYNQHNGLRHLTVLGTLEDDEGMIWIISSYGILRLNPATGTIRNFGREHGLRPVRMNWFSFYKREIGELMFGGIGGVSYFQPSDIPDTNEPPLIHLVKLGAGDTSVNLSGGDNSAETMNVDWGSNSINIEYISVNFRNPDETTYSYKLEGFHSDWVDAGTRRFAQFSNLAPKTYTFRVRAINADGIPSMEAASVSFVILPPWYRTWWAYAFYLMLFIVGIVAVDRVQRRRVQQQERDKAREKELQQAREIEKAYKNLEVAHKDLEQAHTNLKSAQDQLVQQEKLASLGQLTAGIAHEIKNPLNFVNNFSEVSLELVVEVRNELSAVSRQLSTENKGKVNEALEILDDIEANLRKIHEHGSRADGIVKSMLQHSRGGSGKAEPTDLNTLIKEYVNLAFHGMRAGKDPINVDIDLQLNEDIGEVPLIAEDFSRVILNLCNNAFDAMREKLSAVSNQPSAYQPKLRVRTLQKDNTVTIEIEDNGPGIPEEIKDKILQPFFTTKKGTEGTGLGLSITNDIIKAHGGTLDITSIPSEKTILRITLVK